MLGLIVAGYVYLLATFGWPGLVVLAVHIGTMLLTIRR